MVTEKTFISSEVVKAAIAELTARSRSKLMGEIRLQLSVLEPTARETLPLILSTLIENHVQQKTIAELLETSRTQIARWSIGVNLPKSAGFRTHLVTALIKFMDQESALRPQGASGGNPGETPAP